MPNERITEDYVRSRFKNDPLFSAIKLEEQKTSVAKAKQCLAQASKNLTGKIGSPEFIITFPAMPDDIIVVECKASTKFHQSPDGENPASFAVDGALHYSAFLSKQFNVIAIAVSGDTEGKLKISSFYQKKDEVQVVEEDGDLLDVYSYIKRLKGEQHAQNIESAEITKTAIDLNEELNDYSIAEYERCTLISAILLALQNAAFKSSYKEQATSKKLQPTPARLAQFIVVSIKNVLTDNDIDDDRVSSMLGQYEKIKSHSIAKSPLIKKKKASAQEPNYVLRDITERLEKSVLPLIAMGDKGYDVLGRFYREFIRYAGTDKKTGLVLTPQHITEFFCDVVSLNVNDVVYDSCCGSGGFLISAMKHMLHLAGSNEKKKKAIRDRQLVGIESRTDMFTFACSNMMMSGDGKSHIHQGDSFASEIKAKVRSLKPTVGFLNPPYDVGEDGQLEFIENTLNTLQPGGRCCAVVQMSCVTSAKARTIAVRERLLKRHTLTGVFTMPPDLFHPVGVVTCVIVCEAKKPHPEGYKTFFGYFKDDGYQKTKHIGRVNRGDWATIKKHWVGLYLNREKEIGLSVLQEVKPQDEWCAEAYMQTDYSKMSVRDFGSTVRDYAIHKLTSANGGQGTLASNAAAPVAAKWKEFRYDQIFKIGKGFYNKKPPECQRSADAVPFIGATEAYNGVTSYHRPDDVAAYGRNGELESESTTEKKIFPAGGITVSNNGSVGYAFFQPEPFTCSHDINPLYLLSRDMSPETGMFLCTIIAMDRYRWSYGRKWRPMRMPQSIIRLPVRSDGEPDWGFMETYVKSLPFSKTILAAQ